VSGGEGGGVGGREREWWECGVCVGVCWCVRERAREYMYMCVCACVWMCVCGCVYVMYNGSCEGDVE